jgi:hypothetical protein
MDENTHMVFYCSLLFSAMPGPNTQNILNTIVITTIIQEYACGLLLFSYLLRHARPYYKKPFVLVIFTISTTYLLCYSFRFMLDVPYMIRYTIHTDTVHDTHCSTT